MSLTEGMGKALEKRLKKILEQAGKGLAGSVDYETAQIIEAFSDANYVQVEETPVGLRFKANSGLMSGAEWYSRWKVELAKESLNHKMPMSINAYDLAAKRASGETEESPTTKKLKREGDL